MNLLAIRTLFVQRNGRYDLVSSRTTYADNGADFFIQAGQRLLDTIAPNRKSLGRYHKAISLNESSVLLKKVRYIDTVYVKKSGSERVYLDRKPYSWLLENYGDDFGEKAKGSATFSDEPTADDTLTIDTEVYTFKAAASSTYEITIGATVTASVANAVTKINTSSSICTAYQLSASVLLIEYNNVGVAGNSIVFTTTSTAISLDGTGTLGSTTAGRANQISVGTSAYYSPIISNAHPDLSLSNMTTDESHDLMFGYDRYAKDGILIMPSADAAYTLSIYGSFFSSMVSDLDISYHSEMYPELLIAAANFAVELFMRNTQGMNDWMNGMRTWLKGIDDDLVRSEMVLAGNFLRG